MLNMMSLTASPEPGGNDLSDLLVPEALLPEQYLDQCTRAATDTPEKRLMFAVLLDAIVQLNGRDERSAREAESWIRDVTPTNSPFSFRHICEALRIDPGYLARGLLAPSMRASGTSPWMPPRRTRTCHSRLALPRVRRPRRIADRRLQPTTRGHGHATAKHRPDVTDGVRRAL